MADEIKFEYKGIGDFIKQNRLVVPPNQREYSWEAEHVDALFTDFANAIASDPNATYFLGTIVLTNADDDTAEVSDGQQRLATTTILLAAIRDHFFRNGDAKRATTIERDYLKTDDIETTETLPRLQLNVDDREFFVKAILEPPDHPDRKTEPTKESHRMLMSASAKAADHLRKLLEPHQPSAHTPRLLEWVRFIRSGVQIIALRVPDHMNAFVMFETLNDRGLKASQADLLKNHLLRYSGTRSTEAQQKWARMIGVLESLGHDEMTVTYIHHLLITQDGPTKAAEVFDKVRNRVNSQGRALEFLEQASEWVNDYAAIFNSDHSKWNEYGTSARKQIATINRDLQVEQIRPLMFAVARNFNVKEATLAFRLFVNWSVRFLIVGGRGGLLDRNYALRAQEIGKGEIKTAKQLADALADIIPNDALFKTSFAETRVSKAFLSRYYLRALELKRKDDPEPEYVPTDEETTINLEHILPENPQGNWPEFDDETALAYYRRLGNLVILQAKRNSKMGNASFEDKKLVFAKSAYLLTHEVSVEATWGIEQINQRQQRLAELAVKTWPLRLR